MTSDRSKAYGRVMRTLEDLGPSKLQRSEQDRLREVADNLLFCDDPSDAAAAEAIADARSLVDHLVAAGRWTDERAAELADDLAACGPVALVA
jgi:hypothetical protein